MGDAWDNGGCQERGVQKGAQEIVNNRLAQREIHLRGTQCLGKGHLRSHSVTVSWGHIRGDAVDIPRAAGMGQPSQGTELYRMDADCRVTFALWLFSPQRVRAALQSAAAFTHVETAIDESEHGNSSAVSQTKTLGSCPHCIWKRVVPNYAFQYTRLLREPNISAGLFYCLQSFVCLNCWLWNTESPGESSKNKERYTKQMLLGRTEKNNWLVLSSGYERDT